MWAGIIFIESPAIKINQLKGMIQNYFIKANTAKIMLVLFCNLKEEKSDKENTPKDDYLMPWAI